MGIIAGLVTAVVGAGLSAGLSAASAPHYADPASSSRKVSLAQLKALPGQRMVEQAARLGQSVDYPTGKMTPHFEQRQMTIQEAFDQGLISQQRYQQELNGAPVSKGRPNGTPARRPEDTISVQVKTGMTPETRHADFTGYGDADVQGKLAHQMAAIQLGLQQKYGTDFAAEAAKQAALADPEGTAARALLADKINEMDAARKTRVRPVATTLDAQIMDELNRGKSIDPETQAAIEATLARRGDSSLTGGDVERELEAGPYGEQRQAERIQKAMAHLGSGTSATDASFRDELQSMANMSNFLGNRTPTSQFNNLSAGQQGASPGVQGPALPLLNPNGQQLATQAGNMGYAAGVQQAAHQISPWFVGLNALVQGASTAGAAGYKPFANN